MVHRNGVPFARLENDWFDEVSGARSCTDDTVLVELYGSGTTGWGSDLTLVDREGELLRRIASPDGDMSDPDHVSARPRWTPDRRFVVTYDGDVWIFDPATASGAPWHIGDAAATRPWPIVK